MKFTLRDVKTAFSRFSRSNIQDEPGTPIFMPSINKDVVVPNAHTLHVLIPGRLSIVFAERDETKKLCRQGREPNIVYFTSNLHCRYNSYAADFGPVNLSIVYRFCIMLQERLNNDGSMQVLCIEPNSQRVSNACFLLGSFLVLLCGFEPQKAARLFMNSSFPCPVIPFRDATYLPQDFDLSLIDCLSGLKRASEEGWFDLRHFNLSQYESLDCPETGGVHEICSKLVAFKGPLDPEHAIAFHGEISCPPSYYVPIFKRLGVTCVVRLNEKDTYDKKTFEDNGIRHFDIDFEDSTTPSDSIVDQFLAICAKERKIAVHCRAGLGRTGTLIAMWLMRNAGFSANEAIAWLRIVRPGSVIGPQQHYLKAHDSTSSGGGYQRLQGSPTSSGGSLAEFAQQVTAAMRERKAAKLAIESHNSMAVAAAKIVCQNARPGIRTCQLPEIVAGHDTAAAVGLSPATLPSRQCKLQASTMSCRNLSGGSNGNNDGCGWANDGCGSGVSGLSTPSASLSGGGGWGLAMPSSPFDVGGLNDAASWPSPVSRVTAALVAATAADRLISGSPLTVPSTDALKMEPTVRRTLPTVGTLIPLSLLSRASSGGSAGKPLRSSEAQDEITRVEDDDSAMTTADGASVCGTPRRSSQGTKPLIPTPPAGCPSTCSPRARLDKLLVAGRLFGRTR